MLFYFVVFVAVAYFGYFGYLYKLLLSVCLCMSVVVCEAV